jgi:hypothetical protein
MKKAICFIVLLLTFSAVWAFESPPNLQTDEGISIFSDVSETIMPADVIMFESPDLNYTIWHIDWQVYEHTSSSVSVTSLTGLEHAILNNEYYVLWIDPGLSDIITFIPIHVSNQNLTTDNLTIRHDRRFILKICEYYRISIDDYYFHPVGNNYYRC